MVAMCEHQSVVKNNTSVVLSVIYDLQGIQLDSVHCLAKYPEHLHKEIRKVLG